jgi:hypothetical protein
MPQKQSKLERSIERALKEAHEAADSVGRNFLERLKVGIRRPFESVFFDPDNKRWKEPPKGGRFYIVGKFEYNLCWELDKRGELRRLGDWLVVSDFMAEGGENNLQFNELRHEVARAHLEKWFPKQHFRIVLAASNILASEPYISARQGPHSI